MTITAKNMLGEVRKNKFGTQMQIIEYQTRNNIRIKFLDSYGHEMNSTYQNFKSGGIKNPYDKQVQGVGYVGVGCHITKIGKNVTLQNVTWSNMLIRCYNKKYKDKHLAYDGCSVCDEWLNYQNFADWFDSNYYKVEGERMHLDKDILVKGNKAYSPDKCVIVPQRINMLFVTRRSKRGGLPCGVSKNNSGTYGATCGIDVGVVENLGTYKTVEEAFFAYKTRKEKNIKEVADKYKQFIPRKLYDALYNWEVEMTD